MSQSWRSYGSINKFETSNNVSLNNLTVDHFAMKNSYLGLFNINGTLKVSELSYFNSGITVNGNSVFNGPLLYINGATLMSKELEILGNTHILQNLYVDGDFTVGGTLQFEGSVASGGNLLAVGTTIMMGYQGKKGNEGTLIFNTDVNGGFMGINIPLDSSNVLPGTTLEVNNKSTQPTSLYVHSVNETSQSVLTSNNIQRGLIALVDNEECSINMFLKTPFSTYQRTDTSYVVTHVNKATDNDTIDARITYDTNGKMSFTGQTRLAIPSSISIGQDLPPTQFNETLSLYTNTRTGATPFLYDLYGVDISGYSTWNTLSVLAPDNSSNTFMNVFTPSGEGLRVGGGTYINDLSRSVGIIGITVDNQSNWVPSQMIVSGTNKAYCKTTTGINTYAPSTEKYTLDINGAVSITNGEISQIEDLSNEIIGMVSCRRNRSHAIAFGSVSEISGTSYSHYIYYTKDTGITWTKSIEFADICGNTSEAYTGFIYDNNYSLVTFRGWIYVSIDGNLSWYSFALNIPNNLVTNPVIDRVEFSGICKAINIFDVSNQIHSTGKLIVYAYNQQIPNNYITFSYAYLSNISNIENYLIINTSPPFLNSGHINVNDVTVINGIDGYDTSYIFLAGDRGIRKYKINLHNISSSSEYDPRPANIISDHIDNSWNKMYNYTAMQTYKEYDTYGNLLPDSYFTVFVGDGIITSTNDGGQSFHDFIDNTSDISFTSVYIHNNKKAIVSGKNGTIYVTYDGGYTWSSPTNEFNRSGLKNVLMNTSYHPTSICMTSDDDFIVARVDKKYIHVDPSTNPSGQVPNTKLFYCHLPALFNRDDSSVLDICGSTQIYGSAYVQNNVNIDGYLNVNSGTVQIHQTNMDSTSSTSGAMIINGGMGITGNITTDTNVNIGNSLHTGNIISGDNNKLYIRSINNGGNITIGGNNQSIITIGQPGDSVFFEGLTRTKGALSTTLNTLQLSVELTNDSSLTQIPGYTGLTIGNVIGANNYPGYLTTDATNTGFLFKSPNDSTSANLSLIDLALNSGVTNGLMSIQRYTSDTPNSLDPSFIISCNPEIDIGTIVLTSSVNGSTQNIGTDVTVGGRFQVSGSDSGINVYGANTNSNNTNSGTVVVKGGLGVSGTANIDTLNVASGGANINGSSSITGQFTVNSTNNPTTPYSNDGAMTIKGGVGISKDVSVGGNISAYQSVYYRDPATFDMIKLSMTDFSNNVTFYKNEPATNTSSGTLRIMGGMGITGNIYTGGNVVILGNIDTNDYKKGSLIVTGGVGISANAYVGGNVKIYSTYESIDTSSGALQVLGGAGIKGNVHTGGNVVIYSTVQSVDASSGALRSKGGAGIRGNLFVGGNITTESSYESYSTSTGALRVTGGAGIKGNVNIGGNTAFTGTIQVNSLVESVSSYTGSIDTTGGVGIQGNLFVDNQTYIGSQVNLLSGLVAYYPLDTDYNNYVSGSPVSDLLINNAAYKYNILSNNVNKCIGPPSTSTFDVSYSIDSNPVNSTVVYLYASDTGSLINSLRNITSITVSFWLNVTEYNVTANETATIFDFNHANSGVGTGISSFGSTLSLRLTNSQQLQVIPSSAIAQSNGSTNLIGSNTWRMVTVVVDNTLVARGSSSVNNTFLYIDGVYDSSWGPIALNYIDADAGTNTIINTFGFGNTNKPQVTANKYYHYNLDDFRIYDRPLSPIEVRQLYDSSGLALYTVNNVYTETRSMNPNGTTFSHTYGSVSSYQTLSVPTNTTMAITGNLAVTGATNIRGNTSMLGDLTINGNIIQNGYRMGRYLTDSSMIIAGDGGYFGGSTTVGNVYLKTLTLGTGGYFGGSLVDGSINLLGINVGVNGYYGGSTTTGNILVNKTTIGITSSNSINSGALQVLGGAGIVGNVYVGGNVVMSDTTASTSYGSGALQVSGGAGFGGNVYIGSTTLSSVATSNTGALVVGGGVYTGGNVYINSPSSTSLTDASKGALVVSGGVYTGGNIYIGSTASSNSTTTGSLLASGGAGIKGNVYVGGNVVIKDNSQATDISSGALQVYGGASIGGNTYIGTINSIRVIDVSSQILQGAAFISGGVYTSGNVYIGSKESSASATPNTGALVVKGGVYTGGIVNIGNTTASNSTTTGSLIASGGAGIVGNVYVGGNVVIKDGTACTSSGSGALQVIGGAGFGGSVYTAGIVKIENAQSSTYSASTSSTAGTLSGALQVGGGIGVNGIVNIQNISNIDISLSTATTLQTGALNVAGSTYIAGNLLVGGYITNFALNNILTYGKMRANAFYSENATIGTYAPGPKTSTGTLTLNVSNILSGSNAIKIDENVTLYGGNTGAISNKLSVYGLNVGVGGITGGSQTVGDLSLNKLTVGTTVTATSFNALSDYRIKTNVMDMDETFTIDNLRPVKYTNTQTKREDMGFIAHEVQEEFPFLVSGNKDDENYQSLNYIGLIGVLVNEVKQLKKRLQIIESHTGTYNSL